LWGCSLPGVRLDALWPQALDSLPGVRLDALWPQALGAFTWLD